MLNEKVTMRREAGAIQRYHIIPHHGIDTVASHSWNATTLLLVLNPTASRKLIIYMLHHDITERWTGDIPAAAKGMFPTIMLGVKEAEKSLEQEMNLPSADGLTEEEQQWARAIDALESALWCHEQLAMGNQMVKHALEALATWIEKKDCVPSIVRTFYQNYTWKRYSDYLITRGHYGNNE